MLLNPLKDMHMLFHKITSSHEVQLKINTWRRYVSLEFLNGTCSSFFAKANMTSLSDDKLLLMAWLIVKKKVISQDKCKKLQERIKVTLPLIPEFLSADPQSTHSWKDAHYRQGQLDSAHLVLVDQCSNATIKGNHNMCQQVAKHDKNEVTTEGHSLQIRSK